MTTIKGEIARSGNVWLAGIGGRVRFPSLPPIFFAANFRDGECHATIFVGAFASFYVLRVPAPIGGTKMVFNVPLKPPVPLSLPA